MSYYSTVLHQEKDAAHAALPRQSAASEQMSPSLDELSLKFAIWARHANRNCLDIGCGDGLATTAALARGGHVLAVDPDHVALHRLLMRTPLEQYRRLRVRAASLPDLDLKSAHFAGVHAARVVHLLEPQAFQQSLRNFCRWLYPGGKLFMSALAPSGSFWAPFHAEFSRRQHSRERWPGYIQDITRFLPEWESEKSSIHLLDESVLGRELEEAGFVIEELSEYELPWDTEQNCHAVIARCDT